MELPYERYALDNGIDVVLHVDRSDPVAAVALVFHAGSSHEAPGRTGFAHLFEHLFFQDSENLGPGGLDRLMTRVGSSTNGSTSRDRTRYFEVVPRDALEKTLWAEADKVGFFIKTVTDDVLAKEKQVVKNEKRQDVDNQPYGHLWYVVDRALYPEGHPYRWQVIGSIEDLDAATLDDVHDFHEQWYGPGNALLVVSGDIDVAQTKGWIDRYFAEIPARDPPARVEPPAAELTETVRFMHEDNFARLPQLTLAWPTVPSYHPDSYALVLLGRILADGKSCPIHQVIVEELELAPDPSASNFSQELAGRFTLQVRAYADRSLDDVMEGLDAAFGRFGKQGVLPEELWRVKHSVERQFYQSHSSVLGKAFQLAHYTLFTDSPGFGDKDLEHTLAVTGDDIVRVYEQYIRGRPHVAASFVPRGQPHLALSGSAVAEVVEEAIGAGADAPVEVRDRGDLERTPSRIDRSVEPPFGEAPILTAPTVWKGELANGLRVVGIEDRDVPLVQFSLRFPGGMLLDDPSRIGVANLLAETMMQGTENLTPDELEIAIELLGATMGVSASRESFSITGTTLARNWVETLALLEEILLEPRFDPREFELARHRVENQIQQRAGEPNAIAANTFVRILYDDHILGGDLRGTLASVAEITLEDLRSWHAANLVPALGVLHVAGETDRYETLRAMERFGRRWKAAPVPPFPVEPAWDVERAGVYFVDVPGSAQSVLRVGYLAMSETDPDYWPAQVMNFRLGGGGFASELMLTLREGLGYTYGIGSSFRGGALPGPFQIGSAVQGNVTLESLVAIRHIVDAHGPGFTDDDLAITRDYLTRNNAGAFATLGAKVGLLREMSVHGFPPDFELRRAEEVAKMTVEGVRNLADRYLDTRRMAWLVVGDARTQLPRLEELGLGPVTLLESEPCIPAVHR